MSVGIKYTDQQIAAALLRIQAQYGSCRLDDYQRHKLPAEPSVWGIIWRYGTFNDAKEAVGLPIVVRARHKAPRKIFETELKPTKRSTYPCWKCQQPFKGLGRRHGNWHCEQCAATITAQASSMGW